MTSLAKLKKRKRRLRRRAKPRRKLEPNPTKSHHSMTGLVAKEPKARRKVGLIVIPQTAAVATSLVECPTDKRERNIHHVDQLQVPVRKKARESLGVKKQRKVKRNEHHKRAIEKHHSRRTRCCPE
jgi:hypothetical protein